MALHQLKRYIDGEINYMRESHLTDFSQAISTAAEHPQHAASVFRLMGFVDVISIIKSHITLEALLSAAIKNGRKSKI